MKAKIILAGESAVFTRQYNPFDSLIIWKQEGPSIQQAFRNHEMLVKGKTPKQPVVEEATVAVEVVPQPVVEAVPAEQPTAPTTPTPTTPPPPPSTPTAEVPKRKLALKLKGTTAPEQRPKPKLVLKNQPSQ